MARRTRGFTDLALVTLWTGIVGFAVTGGLTGVVRIALVLPLVTFLPGYALFAFLYPSAGKPARRPFDENEHSLQNPLPTKRGLEPVERFGFSAVSSIALVPAVALVANFTPWGVTLFPIVAGLGGLTLLFTIGAISRKARLPAEQRYAPSLSRALQTFDLRPMRQRPGTSNRGTSAFTIALVVGALLFTASLGYAAAYPPTGDQFTELHVGNATVTGDTQSMYPARFDAGESRDLPLVVTNQEGSRTQYGLVVSLQRVDGAGRNARVLEEDRLVTRSFTLDQGETGQLSLSVSPTMTGSDLRLVVLLYTGDPPGDPSLETAYRSLRLPIDVGR